MTNMLFTHKRKFRIQAYLASHSQLLLRSPKSDLYNTRIDVLFGDVYAWHLGIFIPDLTVFETNKDQLATRFGDLSMFEEPGTRWFHLCTSKWDGFVCSGDVRWKEDNGEFYEASSLIPDLMYPGMLNPGNIQ